MKFLQKYVTKYLNVKIIFALDMCLSLLASLVTIACVAIISDSGVYSFKFSVLYLIVGTLGFAFAERIIHPYKNAIRHMTIHDVIRIVLVSFIKATVFFTIALATKQLHTAGLFYIAFDFFGTIFATVGARVIMVLTYESFRARLKREVSATSVLIFGTGTKAVSLVTRLATSSHYHVAGFISQNPVEKGLMLHEKPVLHFETNEEFLRYCNLNGIHAVLFAHESDAQAEGNGFVRFCYLNKIKVLISPSVDEIVGGKVMRNKIREIKIEDLLGRDEIQLNIEDIKANFGGKVVMVTGAAGSIGSELVRQLATFGVRQLILYDNAETPMHNLRLELEERFPDLDFVPVIGDVRILARLDYAFKKWHPQVVFHAAAYKHVPLMEENPCEAVLVNVAGSRNVADKCIEYGVEKMVMVSTDKAVNPTNIMGCTKRLAEIYVQSLGVALENGEVKGNTKFVTTRFGNVLGSNGSVIPRFREQIEKGGPVTVTHPDIIRFFMTIPEACRLVMEAATLTSGNQIFVFDMGQPVKIDDLAHRMIELAGLKVGEDINIEYTGLRPGEKLYEEVLANDENTQPTVHERIKIATVREYPYAEANEDNHQLETLSREYRTPEMVKLMKAIVPEFKSKNSCFEVYDNPEDEESSDAEGSSK